MGSSWIYCHVPIKPYSIRGFHTLARRFSWVRLYSFTGSHFASMDEPVNSLVGEKLQACIEVNRKTNWPNWPAPPFNSIFQPRWAPTISNLIPFTMVGRQRISICLHVSSSRELTVCLDVTLTPQDGRWY